LEILSRFTEFDWNKGNRNKNLIKHAVSDVECEEIFFNIPLMVSPDKAHSKEEERYYLLGKTDNERLLFLVFTARGDKIRVISARDMTKKEQRCYHEAEEDNSEIQDRG